MRLRQEHRDGERLDCFTYYRSARHDCVKNAGLSRLINPNNSASYQPMYQNIL